MKKISKKLVSSRRRNASILVVLMAVALLLTGTFAWYKTANKINKFMHEGSDKSVVLHDDFEGGPKKHIYVENTSETTDIFVRIKLQEFMDLTSFNDRVINPNDWTTHIPGTTVDNCGLANLFLEKFHDNFQWFMGGQKWYLSNQVGTSGNADSDLNDYDPSGAYYQGLTQDLQDRVKQTNPATVISMAQYFNLADDEARKAFVGWVYDADGWAYWSQALPAGEATGLLLKSVEEINGVDDLDYFYAINVNLEAVDKSDLPMWFTPSGNNDGLGQPSIINGEQTELGTNNAGNMFDLVSNVEVGITGIEIGNQPAKTEYLPGETFDSTGMTIIVHNSDGTDDVIDSGFTITPSGSLSQGTNKVTISYGGYTTDVQIKVSALKGLYELPSEGVFTIDGEQWQKVKDMEVNGQKYVMLTSAKYTGTFVAMQFHPTTIEVYEGSNLQTKMTAYYQDYIKSGVYPTLKEVIVVPDISTATSLPTANFAKNSVQDKDMVFAISREEAAAWTGSPKKSEFWTRTVANELQVYIAGNNLAPRLGARTNLHFGQVFFWVLVD